MFISYLFEQEGAVGGILEALKDGNPKLQQAYLNIISMIFLHTNANTQPKRQESCRIPIINSENSPEIDVDKILHTLRDSILQPETILPSLLRLIEQGGSSAVRAKALIAAQLLCRHSPSLLVGTWPLN